MRNTHIFERRFIMGKFRSTDRKGFQITFENGLTVSVQWGAGNYCDNYHDMDFLRTTDKESSNAEVAVWSNNCWLYASDVMRGTFEGGWDTVMGYLTPEEVVELLAKAKNYTAEEISKLEEAAKKEE
jgi:hypothetical protein